MQARHRYLVADLVTDQALSYIPLTEVEYSRRINAQGDFNATLPVANTHLGEIARLMMSRPVALYVERYVDGTRGSLWWGGIVWNATPARDRRGATSCPIIGATFDSIAKHRKIWTDLDFEGVDRGQVLAQLWESLQSQPGNSSLGVSVPVTVVGGGPWTGGWRGTENAWYADAMNSVASAEPPFEWTIDVYADNAGTRHRALRIGTPQLGNPENTHLLCTPSSLVGWSGMADNTRNATNGLARGAVTAKNVGGVVVPVTSTQMVNATAVADGAPRIDVAVDHPETEDVDQLDAYARALVGRRAPKPSVTVRPTAETPLSPAILGDSGRVVISDPMFNDGRLDTTSRIIGVKVKPAARGRDEEVTFEFQSDDSDVEAA